jgi:hypothetical protein
MSAVKQMRNEVKKYIDSADEKVVKMVHAMLEADADDLRKQLVMEERASYLKGEGKSFNWDEVKDMADTKKFKLSADQLKLVEQEKEKHIKGKSKSYSWPEAKEIIRGKRKL